MNILIISDTHGSLEAWNIAVKDFFNDADLILHAGDILYHGPRNSLAADYAPAELGTNINTCTIPVLAAKGNCDSAVDMNVLDMPMAFPYVFSYIDGMRIVVTHGHLTESLEDKSALANKLKADIFISGHTHVACVQKYQDCVFVNPGSPALSKRTDGRQTVAVLDVSQKIIRIYDLYSKEIVEEYKL